MAGYRGDDVYRVSHPDDVVIERDGEGIDEIQTNTPYTLPAHVENLSVSWTHLLGRNGESLPREAAVLRGNSLNNYIRGAALGYTFIYGMEGDDTLCACGRYGAYLDGGDGNDTLINNVGESRGGPGADTFIGGAVGAHTDPRTPSTILDFNPGEGDRIQVSHPQPIDAATMFAQGYLIWDPGNRRLTWTTVPFDTRAGAIGHNFRLPNFNVHNFDPSWIRVVVSPR